MSHRRTKSGDTLKMKSLPNIRLPNAGSNSSSMFGQLLTSLAQLEYSCSSAARFVGERPIGFYSTSAETSPGRAAASASANDTPMQAPITWQRSIPRWSSSARWSPV